LHRRKGKKVKKKKKKGARTPHATKTRGKEFEKARFSLACPNRGKAESGGEKGEECRKEGKINLNQR